MKLDSVLQKNNVNSFSSERAEICRLIAEKCNNISITEVSQDELSVLWEICNRYKQNDVVSSDVNVVKVD